TKQISQEQRTPKRISRALPQTHQDHHCRLRCRRGRGQRLLHPQRNRRQRLAAAGTTPNVAKLGSNARSGPASGGASGTVASVSTSSFTMSTSAGQRLTVDEVHGGRRRLDRGGGWRWWLSA